MHTDMPSAEGQWKWPPHQNAIGVQMASNSPASPNGIHHFIRQSGMGVRRPLLCSFVDVLLVASRLSVCSSLARTMVAPLLRVHCFAS